MKRARGNAPWHPKPDTLVLIGQVSDVLDEYRVHWPLTLRQVFYRLVGAYDYAKTDRAYKQLGEHLNRARRAGMIPWSAIRDDGLTAVQPDLYPPWRAFLTGAFDPALADAWTPDPWTTQPHRVELWCEAAGMTPMLARAAPTVPVYSGGGFSSVTALRDAAMRISTRPTVVLHVGDHDPSGVHIFRSMAEDVTAFAEPSPVTFHRVAVLPDHITTYSLPTAPPKSTDNRAFVGLTVQAEALPPDVLSALVTAAVSACIVDRSAWDAGLRQADLDREDMREVLEVMQDVLK